ncbi:phosphatase PAP2 family protein [Rhizobium halophytocola]|uniref:Undecaprenyl-diphosphatase n=1 Tax=Rhizobium halophytocola TaxID=735519 RepID=A0ABS4E1Y1_9HYPH|nr:phosphatase PAP2 family protein [Rhizobium halophytocola]MBP1851960.1 undecaprenyl-diphosphatase [Rhizobium halophytocola]
MRTTMQWLRARRLNNKGPRPSLFLLQYSAIVINLGLLAFLVFDGPVGAGEKQINAYVRQFGGLITDIGRSWWILSVSAILFAAAYLYSRRTDDLRRKLQRLRIAHIGAYLFVSVASATITVNAVKRIVGRARPLSFEDFGKFSFQPFTNDFLWESFPSGHSTTIGAMAMAAALLMPRFRLPLALAAIWLAMTRVMIGVHYPSDVIVGLGWGSWFSLATAVLFARYRMVFRGEGNGPPVPRFHRL